MRSLGGQVVPARTVVALLAAVGALATVAVDPAAGGPAPATTIAAESPATTVPATTVPATTAPTSTAPPTTAPTTTAAPSGTESPAVHPDVMVRRLPAGAWLGRGRTRLRAAPTLEIPARPGQRVRFLFRVSHDGDVADVIVLQAAGAHPRAAVRWLLGGRDVTGAVARGALRLRIPPGAHRDVVLAVTLGRNVPPAYSVARTLNVRSRSSGSSDRVRAIVTRPPLRVRFHDVGGALGLPRRTHSFDFDAGDLDGDGTDDLVMSTHGHVEFFRNAQPGLEPMFVNSVGDLHACAIGEANGDDRADVYCTRGASNGDGAQPNSLWIQRPLVDGLPQDPAFVNRAAEYGVEDRFGRGRHPTFADLDHRHGPDLFVGNENPRSDDNRSLNRIFLSVAGRDRFDRRALGMQADVGALCAQAFDQDGNGWDDLLVCGGAGLATTGWHPSRNRLHLFRNVRRPDGGRRLVDVAGRLGVGFSGVVSARLAHLDGNRHADLLVVTRKSFTIWPGLPGGRFGLPVLNDRLEAGSWVTVADVDGRRGLDVFVVEGCNAAKRNVNDRLYLDLGPGWRWRPAALPTNVAGCGDTAEALDVDGDGVDDLLVGNGQWLKRKGPVQVLTSGRYWG